MRMPPRSTGGSRRRRATRLASALLVGVLLALGASADSHAQLYRFGKNKVQFDRFEWQKMETEHFDLYFYPEEAELKPHVAGIPGEVWVVYIPNSRQVEIQELSSDGKWMATYIDPKNGNEYPIGEVSRDAEGNWKMPRPEIFQDWILILKNEK